MTAREQGGDVDVAALVEVAQARGAVTLTAREMAAVAKRLSDAWADADLARESEKGWRREADELAEKVARAEALAHEWGSEGPSLWKHAHSAGDVHEGQTLERCADGLRAALGGES